MLLTRYEAGHQYRTLLATRLSQFPDELVSGILDHFSRGYNITVATRHRRRALLRRVFLGVARWTL